jgi:AhpD family alkylhydroperoxidase
MGDGDAANASEAMRTSPELALRVSALRLSTPPLVTTRGGGTMRIEFDKVFPEALQAMFGLERAVRKSSLEPALLELVKLRASQLNGCGYCIDMHTKDARARGETEQRLYLTSAWREAPCYSERERAALAWAEALTLLPQTGAPDDVYERVAVLFSKEEVVALTLAIVAINGWNRLAVGMRSAVGSYQPPAAVRRREGERDAAAAPH